MDTPPTDTPIPNDVLARPIAGRGLSGRTLGEELSRDGHDRLTLLVFLRHAG